MKILIAAIAALLAVTTSAIANSEIRRFYQGKRIQVIVGSGAGGGYDNYARQVARHLGRFIPGSPTLVVQNMPGAGGVVAANFVANVAPKDGTIIIATQREVPLIELMGPAWPALQDQSIAMAGEPVLGAWRLRGGHAHWRRHVRGDAEASHDHRRHGAEHHGVSPGDVQQSDGRAV